MFTCIVDRKRGNVREKNSGKKKDKYTLSLQSEKGCTIAISTCKILTKTRRQYITCGVHLHDWRLKPRLWQCMFVKFLFIMCRLMCVGGESHRFSYFASFWSTSITSLQNDHTGPICFTSRQTVLELIIHWVASNPLDSVTWLPALWTNWGLVEKSCALINDLWQWWVARYYVWILLFPVDCCFSSVKTVWILRLSYLSKQRSFVSSTLWFPFFPWPRFLRSNDILTFVCYCPKAPVTRWNF